MFSNPVTKYISLAIAFLIPFFYLINNINYYTSTLRERNKSLIRRKESLETSLESKTVKASGDLATDIETKRNRGQIEPINTSDQISIFDLRKNNGNISSKPSRPAVGENPSVVGR